MSSVLCMCAAPLIVMHAVSANESLLLMCSGFNIKTDGIYHDQL